MIVMPMRNGSPSSTPVDMPNGTMRATYPSKASKFSQLRNGSIRGFPDMRADSLRLATMEPVNVTPPMKMARPTSPRW